MSEIPDDWVHWTILTYVPTPFHAWKTFRTTAANELIPEIQSVPFGCY